MIIPLFVFDKQGESIKIQSMENLETLPDFCFEIMLQNVAMRPHYSGPLATLYLYSLLKCNKHLEKNDYSPAARIAFVSSYMELFPYITNFHVEKIPVEFDNKIRLFPLKVQQLFKCSVKEMCDFSRGIWSMTPYINKELCALADLKEAKHLYVNAITTVLLPAFC